MPDSPPPKPDGGMGTDPGDEPKAEETKPEGAELKADLEEKIERLFHLQDELKRLKEKYEALGKRLNWKLSTEDRIRNSKKIKRIKKVSMLRELNKQISNLLNDIHKIEHQLLNKKEEFSDVFDDLIQEYEQLLEDIQRALDKEERSPDSVDGKREKKEKEKKDDEDDPSDTNPEELENEIEGEEPDASINDFDRYLQYIHRLKEINNEIRRITWGRRSGLVWAALNMHLAGFLGHFFLPVIGYYFGARWIVRREIKQRLRAQAKLNSLAVEAASILKELGPLHQRVQETLRGEPKDKFDEAARGFLRGPVEQAQENLRKILTKASKHDRNRRRGSSGPGGREDGERPGKTRSRRFGGRATEPSRER